MFDQDNDHPRESAEKVRKQESESAIPVSTILELRSFDDTLTYIVDRRLHELSFKPLSELDKFIASRTGVNLFATPDIYRTVLLASEVRNLIAHNDCMINDIFRQRVGDALPSNSVLPDGKFDVSDEWMRNIIYMLDGVVFDFDSQVSAKFGIPTIESIGFKGSRPGTRHGRPAIEILPLSEEGA